LSLSAFAQVNQTDAKGRKQGVWEKIYPGTRVYMYKGEFKDDKPNGTFVYFYKSGKSKAVIEHSATPRSEGYFYHETGGVMSYGIYTNFKKDSIWVNWDNIGRLSSRESYKNDSLHGMKVIYYLAPEGDKSQRPMTILNYNNGQLHGEFKEYFDSGKLKNSGTYENNKKVGVWETYHVDGGKMSLERYQNGVRHGWCIGYDKNGKEEGRKYFYRGHLLEGKQLKQKMSEMKRLGISPNG
jgi:antitoxin component YwqK of YwqJK toxin-antitoxin module